MVLSRRSFVELSGAAAILASWGGPLGQVAGAEPGRPAGSRVVDPEYHFLNRISYGVRAADLARCKELGIAAYLEEQLNPETIKTKAKVKLSSTLKKDRLAAAKGKDASFKCRVAITNGFIQRAANSPAQLFERMFEFWSDHFNITFNELEPDLLDFQREVLRKHCLGNFGDMLRATARHPAMLYYLDNYLNTKKKPQENYARELMELHTIGVDGGYSETDVKEVARAFTGWTVDDAQPGGFFFDEDKHDMDPKTVLGLNLPGGRGTQDGEDVIEYLLKLPQTAQYLSKKLCVRFVSDTPPQSLIDAMAVKWQETNGDIKSVLRVLFLSSEFAASAGAKFKRPLDWYAGVVRVANVEFKDFWYQNFILEKVGQVPFGWEQPNGYPDTMTAWANTNGLLERWNAGYTLIESSTNDKKSGIKTELLKRIGKVAVVGQLVDKAAELVLGVPLETVKRNALVDFVSDSEGEGKLVDKELISKKLGSLLAVLFASPMFQFR